MSGPVTSGDPLGGTAEPAPPVVELLPVAEARVGETTVRRALPRRSRRTVGAWCFADHMGPVDVDPDRGLDIGPHPHTGLQTVTWLLDGQALHKDSLGTEQVIAPGQLNLMTAGYGVSHAEEKTGHYRGTLEGIQLWLAQPSSTRGGEPAFEHHAELPRVELANGTATVVVGELFGTASPARQDTPLVGAELALSHGASLVPLEPTWEHALVVLRGTVAVEGRPVDPEVLAYLGTGRDELELDATEDAVVMLLGGEPFEEPVLMWWNYVARSREEVVAAHASWVAGDDRFGRVPSALPRIPSPAPPWS